MFAFQRKSKKNYMLALRQFLKHKVKTNTRTNTRKHKLLKPKLSF